MFGISKQAYYKRIKADLKKNETDMMVLQIVHDLRKIHPRMGTRKLHEYVKIKAKEMNIKIGRDALFTLLRNNSLLVKKTKRFHITTNSNHFFYKSPNLLKETTLTHSEQAVVCDITYIKTDEGNAYLALVTDPYSKKIMGHAIDDNMKVELVKDALKTAYKSMIFKHEKIIHHSDRGIQYCCPDYSEFAEKMGFVLSTTQQYDPYENAVAERINETLKYEYGLGRSIPTLEIAKKMVKQAIDIYNKERIHWSLGLKTPEEAHKQYDKMMYKSYSKKVA